MQYHHSFRLSMLLIIAALSLQVSAQQYTFSMTSGWTIPFAPSFPDVRANTYGADWAVSWPAIHAEGHRAPCEIGLKGNATFIPGGIAGNRIGIEGFVTTPFPFIDRLIQPATLAFQLGSGLGFYTHPKDLTGDPRNEFIGSCANCVIDIGPVLTLPTKDDHAWVIGAKFVHNSNGYIHKPNVGLNYVQGEIGWRFSPAGGRHREHADTVRFHRRYDARTAPFISIAPGVTVPRHNLAGNDIFRPAYTVQLGYRYAYQPCRSMALSVDLAYNFADNYGYELSGERPPFPLFVALAGTHETHWGPFSLRLGLGYHIWESFPDSRLYERVGVFWHFGKDTRCAAGLAIKANSTHADFIEWTWTYDLL